MTAFQATFVDCKNVRSRSVVQIILEVPTEQANSALACLGGIPLPGQETWVAVACLDERKVKKEPEQKTKSLSKKWNEISYTEQAAIRCADPKFQDWIEHHAKWGCWLSSAKDKAKPITSENARAYILKACRIESRRELNTNQNAAEVWKQIDADYQFFLKHEGLE